MSRQEEHCVTLNRRLRSVGLAGSRVGYTRPSDAFNGPSGYYVAPANAMSLDRAYGAGTEYRASGLGLAEARAYVAGMIAAVHAMAVVR